MDKEFIAKNLDEFPALIPISGYRVCSWTPERDGKGKPEQVYIMLDLNEEFDGVSFAMRLKSKRAINEMIDTLIEYREEVWGDEE